MSTTLFAEIVQNLTAYVPLDKLMSGEAACNLVVMKHGARAQNVIQTKSAATFYAQPSVVHLILTVMAKFATWSLISAL